MSYQFPFKQNWRPAAQGTVRVQRPAHCVSKVNRVLVVDAFDIPAEWIGASYIACVLSIDSTLSQSWEFRLPVRKPSTATFCPCISWIVSGVRLRYKLWEAVDEVLNYPLYAGEVIPVGAIIELWTVNDSSSISLGVQWKPAITLLDVPAEADQLVGTNYATTPCSIFLTNYPPANLSQYFTTCAS